MKNETNKNNGNIKEGKKENVDENKGNKNPLQSKLIKKRTLKDKKVKFFENTGNNLNNEIKQKDTNVVSNEINTMKIQNNNKSNINKILIIKKLKKRSQMKISIIFF